ncbi:hypothetical protein HRI91_005063 [Salmonella enterica]|nr:hypothetical protein [Salmonella enterica]
MNKMPISFIINGLIFNILYENKIFYLTDGDINLINRLCYDDLYAMMIFMLYRKKIPQADRI